MPQHALEVAEEARQPLAHEMRGALLGRGLLVLVVQRRADRVMRVVHLADEVGDRELQLERVHLARLVGRSEPVPPPEEVTDRSGLREHEIALLQHGRREHRMAVGSPGVERSHRFDAATLGGRQAADVGVSDTGVLEHEAHELAAPGDLGPVVELVVRSGHRNSPGWHRRASSSRTTTRADSRDSSRRRGRARPAPVTASDCLCVLARP